ncbi:SurA N-terminal domain-containing protein [Patescibacteria group bacterium]
MPKAKKTTTTRKKVRKTKPSLESMAVDDSFEAMSPIGNTSKDTKKLSKNKNFFRLIILVLVITGFVLYKRGYIVSATVSGKPIFTWQLLGELNKRFGKQTLEGMITEEMIRQEVKNAKVIVNDEELNEKVDDLLAQFGGNVKIEDVLKFQGISKEDFDKQIWMQIAVEKILAKDLTISEIDIDNYLASNSAMFDATDSSQLRKDAEKKMIEEFVADKIQPWFEELKNKTKITRFVE